jgi:uncharacterized protein (DUF1810 family)
MPGPVRVLHAQGPARSHRAHVHQLRAEHYQFSWAQFFVRRLVGTVIEMPAPRQMRYGGEELDTDAQAEAARALVEKLRRCLIHHRRARPRASAPRPSVLRAYP